MLAVGESTATAVPTVVPVTDELLAAKNLVLVIFVKGSVGGLNDEV